MKEITNTISNAEAVNLWIESLKMLGRSRHTIFAYKASVKAWLRDVKLGAIPPVAVTEAHVDNWINNPESTIKLTSRKMHLAAIRDYFTFCCHRELSLGNPAEMVEVNMNLLSREQKVTRKKQPFTDEEFSKVIDFLTERKETGERYGFWILAMKIARNSVLRLGDICNLEWADFRDGYLVKPNRITKLEGVLKNAVSDIPRASSRLCFPKESAIINSPQRSKLSVQFGRICSSVGVHRTFHDLQAQ